MYESAGLVYRYRLVALLATCCVVVARCLFLRCMYVWGVSYGLKISKNGLQKPFSNFCFHESPPRRAVVRCTVRSQHRSLKSKCRSCLKCRCPSSVEKSPARNTPLDKQEEGISSNQLQEPIVPFKFTF